jgi:protein gp37
VASSTNGRQHLWLWLTKRPKRMADFGQWLQNQGDSWPDSLVAMTSVTSQKTAFRVDQLRLVPSLLKGLSCEPLFGKLSLDLSGIDWLITGGGSDTLAELRIPMLSDTCSNSCRTAFQSWRTVFGAKRRAG